MRRIKKFFDEHPCRFEWTLPKEGKLLDLYLVDADGTVIKSYM